MLNNCLFHTLVRLGVRSFTGSALLEARKVAMPRRPIESSVVNTVKGIITDFPSRVTNTKPSTVYDGIPEAEIARATKVANVTGLISRNGGLGIIRFGLSIVRIISGARMSKAWVRVLRRFTRMVYKLCVPIYRAPPRVHITWWVNPATLGQNRNPLRWSKLANRIVEFGGPISSGFPSAVILAIKKARKQDKRVFHIKFVVQYLKGCSVLLMQAAGRHKLTNPRLVGPAVSRDRYGVPRCIPVSHRRAIRRGSAVVIRFWLSIFSIYRVIEYVGKLNLSTIIKGSGKPSVLPRDDVIGFLPMFFLRWATETKHALIASVVEGRDLLPELQGKGKFFPIFKSGSVNEPGAGFLSTSVFGLLHTAWIWHQLAGVVNRGKLTETIGSPTLWGALCAWSSATGGAWPKHIAAIGEILSKAGWVHNPKFSLGKLGQKIEPAGKIRVFAMVDAWTQFALRPLHLLIQVLLRTIAQDGTFDQITPGVALGRFVKRERSRTGNKLPRRMYSYDLSAATDCLPIWIQVLVLEPLVGPELANQWRILLTERVYRLNRKEGPLFLKYGVGQPMGALSSWVMLALTHHFIVQLAWRDIGRTGWCPCYYVLGDDIVIANDDLAKAYLARMEALGVGIGIHKSLISPNCTFEFAKKLYHMDESWTMIPVKEVIVAQVTPSVMIELKRKYSMSLSNFLALAGFGMRAVSSLTAQLRNMSPKMRDMIVALRAPTGPDALPFSEWVTLVSYTKSAVVKDSTPRLLHILRQLRKEVYQMVEEKMYSLAMQESKLRGFKKGSWAVPMNELDPKVHFGASPWEMPAYRDPDRVASGGSVAPESVRTVWAEFSPFLNEAPIPAITYLWKAVYRQATDEKTVAMNLLIERGSALLLALDKRWKEAHPGVKVKTAWAEYLPKTMNSGNTIVIDARGHMMFSTSARPGARRGASVRVVTSAPSEPMTYANLEALYNEYVELRKELFLIPSNVSEQHVPPVINAGQRAVKVWNTWSPLRGPIGMTRSGMQAKRRTAQSAKSTALHP